MAKKEEKLEDGAKKVYGDKVVTVEYTDKSVFHNKGDRSNVHELQAEKLVAKGVATIVK